MVKAEAYNDDGTLCDIRISYIHPNHFIVSYDIELITDSILNMNADDLKHDQWYEFELFPRWEDDGSGCMRLDWYEITNMSIITE